MTATRPEGAAERAFEGAARVAVGPLLAGGNKGVEEGAFQGDTAPTSFPRVNFYAHGPPTDLPGSQRVQIVADVRVWSQGGDDGARAKLREIDEGLANALEGAQMLGQSGHRVHVLSVGSFQPIPGSHPNIRGRRRVYAFQVVRDAS